MAATQEEKDLYKAKLYVRDAPGWIANLERTGQTANAEHWRAALTWAEGVVSAAGIDRSASLPSPASAPAYTAQAASAPTAPRQRSAAEIRALQLDACTQVWRGSGKQAATQLGVPADVFREAEATIQREATASWDGIVAQTHARRGLPPIGMDAGPAPTADHGWGEIIAAGNTNVGRDAPVTSGPSRSAASHASQGWDAIAADLNREEGVTAPDRMPNGAFDRSDHDAA